MIGDCPNPNKPACHFAVSKNGCKSNEHHLYYPARRYQTEIENAFRELPENKVQICMFSHDLLHLRELPPKKPSLQEMIVALTVTFEEVGNEQAA